MRRKTWIPACILIAFLVQARAGPSRLHRRSFHDRGIRANTAHTLLQLDGEAPRVAIVNQVGFHNEVYAALLWSFQRAGANATVFVEMEYTWAIQDVLRGWYQRDFQPYQAFLPQACDFAVVALATFPEHHTLLMQALRALACPGQQFVLVVHNPDVLLGVPPEDVPVPPLLNKRDTHLLALAPHTVRGTRLSLQRLGIEPPTSLFVPIFPVSLDCPEELQRAVEDKQGCNASESRQGFVLQGLFQAHRRNYDSVFQGISQSVELMNASNFHLSLIGMGSIGVPSNLSSRIAMHAQLPYRKYYRIVKDSFGVLPAFASDIYYTKKASSSVATALICGTPLIADQKMLSSYPYLVKEAVYLTDANETDAQVMERILSMQPEEISARVDKMSLLQERIYQENDKIAAAILIQTLKQQTHSQ